MKPATFLRVSMLFRGLPALVAVLIWQASACAQHSAPTVRIDRSSQSSKSQCRELHDADQKMNALLIQLADKFRSDPSTKAKLDQLQSAWIAYRDAYIGAIFPHNDKSEYGTVMPECQCGIRAQMTNQRIKELQQWTLGIEEGDVCIGSRSTRH